MFCDAFVKVPHRNFAFLLIILIFLTFCPKSTLWKSFHSNLFKIRRHKMSIMCYLNTNLGWVEAYLTIFTYRFRSVSDIELNSFLMRVHLVSVPLEEQIHRSPHLLYTVRPLMHLSVRENTAIITMILKLLFFFFCLDLSVDSNASLSTTTSSSSYLLQARDWAKDKS